MIEMYLTTNTLAIMINGRWHPGIGDPTVLGWTIAISYLIVAVLCWRARRRPLINDSWRLASARRFWTWLAFSMLALGINKQLDLQTLFTQIGRNLAREQGWMNDRRTVQEWFIVIVALVGISLAVWLIWRTRKACIPYRLAIVGIIFLICFIVIRAASFHHIDQILNWRLFHNVKLNALLEVGGIVIIGLAAFAGGKRKGISASSQSQ